MTLRYEKQDGIMIVHLVGYLNSDNAASVENELLNLIEQQSEFQILLDFTKLVYISSAGLRVVLIVAAKLKEHAGQLMLCGMQPHVLEVFEISGFLLMLPIAENSSAGILAMKK